MLETRHEADRYRVELGPAAPGLPPPPLLSPLQQQQPPLVLPLGGGQRDPRRVVPQAAGPMSAGQAPYQLPAAAPLPPPPGPVPQAVGAVLALLNGASEDERCFFYSDPQAVTQGPCSLRELRRWVASLSGPDYVVEYTQFLQSPVWRSGAEGSSCLLAHMLGMH